MKKKDNWYLVEFLSGEPCEWLVAKWNGETWENIDGDIIDYFHARYILISDMEKHLVGKFTNE